jgi:hypothetical protein
MAKADCGVPASGPEVHADVTRWSEAVELELSSMDRCFDLTLLWDRETAATDVPPSAANSAR